MLDYVREGDTIYIKDFSRLARSAKDLLAIVEKLRVKSVNLVSLKENFDTNTPTGKLMLTMFGAIYEFERTNLLERQREGIELAKRAGKYKGRKQILLPSNWGCVYSEWKQRNLTAKAAMVQLGLKPNTFYRFVSETRAKEARING
jgi:DNA invertase Pin-like site-specific DNA recombinase